MADRMENQRPANEQSTAQDQAQASRNAQQEMAIYGGLPSPFSLIRRFSDDVDRLLSAISTGQIEGLSKAGTAGPAQQTSGTSVQAPARTSTSTSTGKSTSILPWVPSVEVTSDGDDLVVTADLPGVSPENVQVEAQGNDLVIRGESRSETRRNEGGYWYSERSYGSFYRSIPLPGGVNPDNARAEFRNGVLKVVFPGGAKVLAPKSHPIKIQLAHPGPEHPQSTQTAQSPDNTSQSSQ